MFDLLIIGAGPAGLTASIYASRYKLKNLVVGKLLGGMMSWAHKVENYPGFTSIPGTELTQKMADQVKNLGSQIVSDGINKIEKISAGFRASAEGGKTFESKTLLMATGMERRKLGVPGEKEYLGKGVSYCSTCDLAFFKEKTIAVIGGADAAVAGAVHAASFAKKVYIIYRREKLRGEPLWTERALGLANVEAIYNTNVTEILGDGMRVTGVKLDKPFQNQNSLPLDGVFVEIGGVPGTELVKSLGAELDERGYVKVAADMTTNIAGLFAAGDIANVANEFQQIVNACAEGALAAHSAFKFLRQKPTPVVQG